MSEEFKDAYAQQMWDLNKENALRCQNIAREVFLNRSKRIMGMKDMIDLNFQFCPPMTSPQK